MTMSELSPYAGITLTGSTGIISAIRSFDGKHPGNLKLLSMKAKQSYS